jgi:hypothetical protein
LPSLQGFFGGREKSSSRVLKTKGKEISSTLKLCCIEQDLVEVAIVVNVFHPHGPLWMYEH